jgi:pimeloyl-ACP methyl ester carboxylesterase
VEAPEIRYAKSGDVSIAYSVVGDGPFDLVFVSGWVLSALEYTWEGPAAAFFRRLASFSRLIVFDKRGTGLSDRTTGIPDLETRMNDIRAVMKAAGSERAAIMGVSEGGPMTLLFAATYQERTAAVILYGSGVSYVQTADYPWANSQEKWDRLIREMSEKGATQEWLQETLELEAPSLAEDEAVRQWWRTWLLTSASPGAVVALWRMNMGIDARHAASGDPRSRPRAPPGWRQDLRRRRGAVHGGAHPECEAGGAAGCGSRLVGRAGPHRGGSSSIP